MAVYQMIFEIILYFSESLIIFYYARNMFEQKHGNIFSLGCAFCGYAILFGVYQLDIAALNIAFILLINIILFILLFQCSFKTALFHSVILLCVMVSCEWILIFIISTVLNEDFNAYQNNFDIHILNVVSSKLLYYFICLIIINVFSKNKKYNKSQSIYWALLIMPLTSLIVLLAFRYITFDFELSENMQLFCAIASALLLVANLVVFLMYEYSVKNWEQLYELKSLNQKQELDKTYLTVLEQNNKDLKILTHDIKNHLEQISNLSDSDAINSYIGKLYSTVNKYDVIGTSQNKILDIIISKYTALCTSKNIDINFNLKTANLSKIDSIDLATILNNVLDNAIDAASQSEKKKITVDIYKKESFEVIKVKNSCDKKPKVKNHKLLTHKKDTAFHGLGIQSVEKTLKSYNGLFDWDYDSQYKVFTTTIVIPQIA